MAAYPLDILEYFNSYAFVIDMPGLDPDDVRVQVKPCNVLLISGEGRRVDVEGAEYIRKERRSMSKFMRKFALPENANTGKITTVLRHGVLTVTVEKLPPPQPRTIEVKHEQLGCRGEDERIRKLRRGAVDRVSMLPDELLLCVLSLLSFKEATATSLLCRRWRYLHTLTTELNFDGTRLIKEVRRCRYKGLDEVVRKYMRWVDGVVRLNRSSYLEKFRVLFLLRESEAQQINEWVRFALSRKVQSLELISTLDCMEHYTLNLHNFDCDLNFLKKLSTHSVKVSGEAVEMLLRNCPLLEHVSIAYSQELLGLEIINPFPSFRSLEIHECENLTSVVVDGSNIAIVKYCGHRVNKVVLVNVPLLTEIWIDGVITRQVEDVVGMFSSVLPQLHTFKLRFLFGEEVNDFCSKFSSLINMSSLKQLVVGISDIDDLQDLLPLTDLIRASPRLQRFVIEELYEKGRADHVEVEPMEIPMASSADRVFLKDCTELKEVEFVGYRGVSKHFELLKHLVENVVALETIVVDPWGFKERISNSIDRIPRRKYNDKIFARANALKHLASFGINVKIL